MTMTAAPPETVSPPTAPETSPRAELERLYHECGLVLPFRKSRYESGDRIELSVVGVIPANRGRIVAEIEKFVGGGFAGQVYRVRLVELTPDDHPIAGLSLDKKYAIKILKPPSNLSCMFRDFLYFLAYQSAFGAQVNPAGVRVGVLWQKLIHRAAAKRFGREDAICDTYATFYDENFRSHGEINEWVEGRIWKFEVDDQLFDRWAFDGKTPADANSPEYVSKKIFMDELVTLLHQMGAPELARQYEWWTCKSQPNALKRLSYDDQPGDGVSAIDFRAGLALLPFLPMSPADCWLIPRGLMRGRLVQFDRGDTKRFTQFIEEHRDDYEDLQPVINELAVQEPAYRRSMPDVTNHHVRLLTDASLRADVKEGAITAWRSLGRIDDQHAERLRRSRGLFALLYTVAFVPLLGGLIVKLWGDPRRREHVRLCLTSGRYLWRAMRGARIQTLIVWHRAGRLSDERALKLVYRPVRFWTQRIFLGLAPPTWHRAICEPAFGWALIKEKINYVLAFLRDPPFREAWLLEQVRLGREEGMLTHEEAKKISDQIKDPFIQKYLKCLAVHICTVPVTQIAMVLVGAGVTGFSLLVKNLSWGESLALGTAAGALIQLMPISPGSIARGLFVLYLMIRERDVKNYYIAAPVSFIHVIGYLAFPLQMVAHDPALARFMAGRWAAGAVRFIPVFGERGGLPEHVVFDVFFNFPLSLKRRFKTRPASTSVWAGLMLAALGVLAYQLIVLGYLAYAGHVAFWG